MSGERQREREIFPLQRLSLRGRGRKEKRARGEKTSDTTRQHNTDEDGGDIKTTHAAKAEGHVTRRLAGATKYCAAAIRDVRETSDGPLNCAGYPSGSIRRGKRNVRRVSACRVSYRGARDDVIGARKSRSFLDPQSKSRAGDDERSHVKQKSDSVVTE